MVRPASKVKMLRSLAEKAKEVANMMEEESPLPLTKKQLHALWSTLRVLDLRNEYGAGYMLRQAFGVELDNERGKGERKWQP